MAKSSKNMTTALCNVKSSSTSHCAQFAHSWPHLLLGYPVERRGRLGPPGQKGFPSGDPLSRQWEMLPLLPLLSDLSALKKRAGALKKKKKKRMYADLLLFFFFFPIWPEKSARPIVASGWQTSLHLTCKHQFVFVWRQMFSRRGAVHLDLLKKLRLALT